MRVVPCEFVLEAFTLPPSRRVGAEERGTHVVVDPDDIKAPAR